jgi:tetratricopeptide (TPR) repeat protein
VSQKPQKKAGPRPKQPNPTQESLITASSYVETLSCPETERNYTAILVKYEESYGLCDPKTLDVLEKLAQAYVDKTDYECAEMIYKRIFVAKQDLDGPSSLSIARILTQIASVAQEQGHYSEAAKCLRRAVEIEKITLGDDDIETINTSARLANVYNSEGKLKEAKILYDDLFGKMEGAKNVPRRLDEKTLKFLECSAKNLRNLGKNEEAAATYTTIIERRRSRSDSDTDPLLASTVVKLADVYEDMGKVNDMQEVLNRGPLPQMSMGHSSAAPKEPERRPEGQKAKADNL